MAKKCDTAEEKKPHLMDKDVDTLASSAMNTEDNSSVDEKGASASGVEEKQLPDDFGSGSSKKESYAVEKTTAAENLQTTLGEGKESVSIEVQSSAAKYMAKAPATFENLSTATKKKKPLFLDILGATTSSPKRKVAPYVEYFESAPAEKKKPLFIDTLDSDRDKYSMSPSAETTVAASAANLDKSKALSGEKKRLSFAGVIGLSGTSSGNAASSSAKKKKCVSDENGESPTTPKVKKPFSVKNVWASCSEKKKCFSSKSACSEKKKSTSAEDEKKSESAETDKKKAAEASGTGDFISYLQRLKNLELQTESTDEKTTEL